MCHTERRRQQFWERDERSEKGRVKTWSEGGKESERAGGNESERERWKDMEKKGGRGSLGRERRVMSYIKCPKNDQKK